MTVNNRCFVEWKEQFVSQERGNRVVHYYLKDSDGESILAVVGNERSVRHMFYVVAEEFLEVYGKEGFIHAGYKWRSRREVVDWLTSMLSKQHLQGDRSLSTICNLIQAPETAYRAINEVSRHTQIADDKGFMSNFKGHDSDIVWSGVAWTCGKQLKHYPAFFRNGIKIATQSFVFVMAKGENHYIAYLEDMYEDRRGQKKVKVRWFHHNKEVKGVIPLRNPHPQEIFITPYSQVISAECVDGSATVLTREHYEKCLSAFSSASPDKIHLCFRQFRGNKVKPFDLSKLRGYFDQPILSCLQLISFQNHESKCNSLSVDEDEKLSAGDNVKLGYKRTRDGEGSPQHCQGVRRLIKSQQMVVYAQSARGLDSLKNVELQPWYNPIYKIDDKIELLCQDSGIRGCWFRCTVMHLCRKHMKVRYDDVQDEDGSRNLEEWIPAFKLARPDKLGMRHCDRPTTRPAPSYKEQGELAVQVGTAVDAWWSDGWWEGVVTRTEDCGDDHVQVYFPGEGLLMKLCKKDLRISRDWLGDRWIHIEAKPDIVSSIFADDISNAKSSVAPSIGKDFDSTGFAMSSHEVHVSNKSLERDVSEDKLECSEGGAKEMNLMNWDLSNQKPSPKEKSTQDDSTEINGSCDNEINGNNDDCKDSNDDNKNGDNNDWDREAFGTSGEDCKSVEHMEDVV